LHQTDTSSPAADGSSHTYGQGLQVAGDQGTLEAVFDRTHDWFWRNRSGAGVTISLRTSGDYLKLERVL
jgi:hypothetical protein